MLISLFSLLLLALPLSPNCLAAHPATKLLFGFWSSKIFLPACRHGLRCCWLPKQPSRALGIQICPATCRPFCFSTRNIALTVGAMPGGWLGVHPPSSSSRRISASFPEKQGLLKPLRPEGIYFQKLKPPLALWCLFEQHSYCCKDKTTGSYSCCHNQPYIPELIYSWVNWAEPLAQLMARVKADLCCCSLSRSKCKSRGSHPCKVALADLLMEVSAASAPPSPWWEMVQGANPRGSCSLSFLLSLGNVPSWMAQGSCRPRKPLE